MNVSWTERVWVAWLLGSRCHVVRTRSARHSYHHLSDHSLRRSTWGVFMWLQLGDYVYKRRILYYVHSQIDSVDCSFRCFAFPILSTKISGLLEKRRDCRRLSWCQSRPHVLEWSYRFLFPMSCWQKAWKETLHNGVITICIHFCEFILDGYDLVCLNFEGHLLLRCFEEKVKIIESQESCWYFEIGLYINSS